MRHIGQSKRNKSGINASYFAGSATFAMRARRIAACWWHACVCLLLLVPNVPAALAQAPGGGSVSLNSQVDQEGTVTYSTLLESTLIQTFDFAVSTQVEVEQEEDEGRATAAQLRTDYSLSPAVTWVTGLNLANKDDRTSVDVQSGFVWSQENFSGSVYAVAEYAQRDLKIFSPDDLALIEAFESIGTPLSEEEIDRLAENVVEWQPAVKAGGNILIRLNSILAGSSQIEVEFEYDGFEDLADFDASFRSTIPSSDGQDRNAMLSPFLTLDEVQDGTIHGPVEGSWAARFAGTSNGDLDFTAGLNSPTWRSEIFGLNLSAQQSTSWTEFEMQSSETLAGAIISLQPNEALSFNLEPAITFDWMANRFGFGVNARGGWQITPEWAATSVVGFRAPDFQAGQLFGRVGLEFDTGQWQWGAYLRGLHQFGLEPDELGGGLSLSYLPFEGLLAGWKVSAFADYDQTFAQPNGADPTPASNDFTVGIGVTIPF